LTKRTLRATVACAAFVAALAFPRAARADCQLESVASAEEIALGWTIHEDHRVVKEVDGAPYEQGGRGNWFLDRETTMIPMCSVFDDFGLYSLRSYMLQPVVTKSPLKICQATENGSVPFVPPGTRPRPADTAHEVYSPYGRPYSGPCPPPASSPPSGPKGHR
jgi:hypothetical protein